MRYLVEVTAIVAHPIRREPVLTPTLTPRAPWAACPRDALPRPSPFLLSPGPLHTRRRTPMSRSRVPDRRPLSPFAKCRTDRAHPSISCTAGTDELAFKGSLSGCPAHPIPIPLPPRRGAVTSPASRRPLVARIVARIVARTPHWIHENPHGKRVFVVIRRSLQNRHEPVRLRWSPFLGNRLDARCYAVVTPPRAGAGHTDPQSGVAQNLEHLAALACWRRRTGMSRSPRPMAAMSTGIGKIPATKAMLVR